MQGRAWRIVLVVGLIGIGALLPAAATARPPASCQVGAPPEQPETFLKPTGEYLVIGCGEAFGQLVELSAFTSKVGLCIGLKAKKNDWQMCPAQPPLDGAAVEVRTWHFGYDFFRVTDVTGMLRADVTRVVVTFRRKSRTRISEGIVGHADSELATRMRYGEPFGYYVAFAPGCAHPKHIEATAFGASGEMLGVARGSRKGCFVSGTRGSPPSPAG